MAVRGNIGEVFRPFVGACGRLGAEEPYRSPVRFRPWNGHIRETGCSVIGYIEWFLERYAHVTPSRLIGELRFEWEMTEWVILRAERTRKLELSAYAYQDCPRGGRVFDCGSCDARSDAYVMEDVSGLDFEVVAVLVAQVAVPRLLRDAIIEIEASNARSACFSCRGGTHRSVGLCYLAQLVVYPDASFHPHTRRMTEAATRNLSKYFLVEVSPSSANIGQHVDESFTTKDLGTTLAASSYQT